MTPEPDPAIRDASRQHRSPDDSPTVLVVDDEPGIVSLYAAWLRDDYAVRTATSGTAALEELSDAVDVVLLDRRMPDLSGDEVLAEIRTRGHDCRVAMVTAVEPDVDVLTMGFDDYLVKPVDREALQDTVHRLLELREHDALVREYVTLASKLAAVESNVESGTLRSNDDYERLRDRFEAVEAAATERLTDLFDEGDDEWVFTRAVAGGSPDDGERRLVLSDGHDD